MNNKLLLCALGATLAPAVHLKAEERPNVLFISFDDMRPELSCYGTKGVISPNFDRIAKQSTVFERAYCQQAVSGPSRNSLLTGLRPDGIGIYNLGTFFRRNVPNVTALPQHFKDNGYQVECSGKIFHTSHGNQDDSISWSRPKWNPKKIFPKNEVITRNDTLDIMGDVPKRDGKKIAYHATDLNEESMIDGRNVQIAIDRLKEFKEMDRPFFMAVGIVPTHLPFIAPKKYWDMYDPADFAIPDTNTPEGASDMAFVNSGELRKYYAIPKTGLLSEEVSRNLIHGYHACVSYADALLGKLLDTLESEGLAENTIIVIWGDHGWKLGEYGNWCKHTNMEVDTNAPLIISSPKYRKAQKSDSIVEFVDIYPTLCDLAGISAPSHLQGTTLTPILKSPRKSVKSVAISQYPRAHGVMGYSMRTDKYRYTRWMKGDEMVDVELYDQSKGRVVEKNLASDPKYKSLIEQLDAQFTNELAKYKNYVAE